MKDLFVSRKINYESIVVWNRNILEFSRNLEWSTRNAQKNKSGNFVFKKI